MTRRRCRFLAFCSTIHIPKVGPKESPRDFPKPLHKLSRTITHGSFSFLESWGGLMSCDVDFSGAWCSLLRWVSTHQIRSPPLEPESGISRTRLVNFRCHTPTSNCQFQFLSSIIHICLQMKSIMLRADIIGDDYIIVFNSIEVYQLFILINTIKFIINLNSFKK